MNWSSSFSYAPAASLKSESCSINLLILSCGATHPVIDVVEGVTAWKQNSFSCGTWAFIQSSTTLHLTVCLIPCCINIFSFFLTECPSKYNSILKILSAWSELEPVLQIYDNYSLLFVCFAGILGNQDSEYRAWDLVSRQIMLDFKWALH